jgi:hypothetical protein
MNNEFVEVHNEPKTILLRAWMQRKQEVLIFNSEFSDSVLLFSIVILAVHITYALLISVAIIELTKECV